ncbi:hypothetical protein BaRGS_00036681 [Batillaria attramentaria]|uniref:Uncharacterized protein n=1 Tax=Batillaria attramentaria TaxID=370345 RepID=A0ABD0JAT4_9CAEN
MWDQPLTTGTRENKNSQKPVGINNDSENFQNQGHGFNSELSQRLMYFISPQRKASELRNSKTAKLCVEKCSKAVKRDAKSNNGGGLNNSDSLQYYRYNFDNPSLQTTCKQMPK